MKYNVWNKLVRRDLYIDNHIIFPSGYGMGEDMTMMLLFAFARKVAYLPKAFYHYVKLNTVSFSHTYSDRHLKELRYNNSSRMINYIPIVGIDGIPECLEAINNYGIFATVMQNPKIQAETLCTVSSNIITGKSPLDGLHFNFYNNKYIIIPYIPVNKYNIDTAIKIYK